MKIRSVIRRGVWLTVLWYFAVWVLPFPDGLLKDYPQNTRFLDQEGRLLRRTLGEGGTDSDWLPLEATGDWAGQALIAVEDQRFYQHPGVDPVALIRATGQNLLHGRVVSGGSTLTTQVIKMIEPRPRTLRTKLIEAFRATQLEMRYSKAFILEQYLNRAPFGGNRQGIATASRRYYGKEPGSLSVGEAALLMGLPQSPSRMRPDRHPRKAEKRRQTVLRRMKAEGMLTGDPLLERGRQEAEIELRAYHFTEWVRQHQQGRTGNIQTTLDPVLQTTCEQVLTAFRKKERYADTDGVGVVVLDAGTGAVRAWVGNWDVSNPEYGYVDTVSRRRAPGSTLKPFVFALAMQQGWLTPDTRLEDRTKHYRDYHPENMEKTFSGDVSAKDALVRSLNIPALQVVDQAGVNPFLGLLRSAGIALPGVQAEKVGLGSVLGGGMETSLVELAGAYTVFANQGKGMRPVGIEGESQTMGPVVAPGVAYWISRMLSGPERDRDLFGSMADVDRPVLAFKTGTSHGLRDAWAIGWNGEVVIGVWVGRMDGSPVSGLTGSRHAAPILGELATQILRPGSWPARSEDVIEWQGRERIKGITHPARKPVSETVSRIVSPTPDFQLVVEGNESIWIHLTAKGKPGQYVHWFINGTWIGKWEEGERTPYAFEKGTHTVRAVFADGTADSRTLTLL